MPGVFAGAVLLTGLAGWATLRSIRFVSLGQSCPNNQPIGMTINEKIVLGVLALAIGVMGFFPSLLLIGGW